MKRVIAFAAGFVVVLAGAANAVVWLRGRWAAHPRRAAGAGGAGGDEPGTRRRMLLADGIPARDIFTDHAGFDTWDSAQRARRVFDVRSAVVVTQGFHMARALLDARRAGLHVTGFVADRRDYGKVMDKLVVREAIARVKALGEAAVGAGPKFLGAQIPITGDGRRSWGPA